MGIRGWGLGIGACLFAVVLVGSAGPVRATGPEDELPDGEGKKILLSACRSCHELTEVTKFRGYYDRGQWRDIVVTMMEYGAPVDEKQVDVLADYLAAHLGKQP